MLRGRRFPTLIMLLGLLGCGPAPRTAEVEMPPRPTPTRTDVLAAATLGPGDVIDVRVYQEAELTGTYRISSDGTFQYPLVGQLAADGLTPNALSALLTEKLKNGFLRDPQVSVFVKEFNSKKIFVLGEVNKPGTFKFEDNMSIVQAITLAGGFKDLAAKNSIVLTRVVEGSEKKFVVPVEAIGMGREQNFRLQPGDIVFVPESWL